VSIADWLALAAIAMAVGFFIGTVGVGGVLLIPALVWLGAVPIHQATATTLFSFLFTGLFSTWLFQRRGSIDWTITRPLLAGALMFSYVGARVNALVEVRALALIIALVVLFAGSYILLPARRGKRVQRDGSTRAQQLLLLLVGGLAGFGSGLSGAGGPLFSVPMMLILGFSPLAVVGAGQVLQIAAALSGTLGNLQFGAIDFAFAAWLTLFELAGVLAGVRAAHAASVTVLRRTAAGLCLLTGVLMLARAL